MTYIVCRYQNGSAFYAVTPEDWESGGEVSAIHLLTGVEFKGNPAYMEKVDHTDIPRNYMLDAMALNPVLCANLPPEFRIESRLDRFGLEQAMGELGEILKEESTPRLEALFKKYTQRQKT